MILWFQEKVDVLEYHDVNIRSTTKIFQLPSVLRLRKYIRPHFLNAEVRLSRQNLFVRDGHMCQYCGKLFPAKQLTVDHVHPQSKGGRHEWTNVVAACSPCNNKKGDLTPSQAGMPLLKKPRRPKWLPEKEFSWARRSSCPESWTPYLVQFGTS